MRCLFNCFLFVTARAPGGGKTYTMDGPRDTTTVAAVPDTDAGVIPRAVDLVLREAKLGGSVATGSGSFAEESCN